MSTMKPGGGGYCLRVVVVALSVLLMICYLLYFLYITGTIERLLH